MLIFRAKQGRCYTSETPGDGAVTTAGNDESSHPAAAAAAPVHPGRHHDGRDPRGHHGGLIGQVSVGFLTATVAGQAARALPELAAYFLAVLALGVLAALGLTRRLKRQTFGLELREIAALLQEREAMLHGIREGVLGYDKNERIVLANDLARQLLDLPAGFVGRPLRPG